MDHPKYQPAPRGHSFRWLLLGLMMFQILALTVCQYAIVAVMPTLVRTFGLDREATALIIIAFGLGFAMGPIIGGLPLDRYGARMPVLAALTLALVGLALVAGAAGSLMLLFSRALLGVAAGLLMTSTVRFVANWFSLHERGKAFALLLWPIPLGMALAPEFLPQFRAWLSGWGPGEWRLLFILLGLTVLVSAVAWLRLYTDDPSRSPHVSARELAAIGRGIQHRHRRGTTKHRAPEDGHRRKVVMLTILVNTFALMVAGYTLFFALVWIPDRILTQTDWDSPASIYLGFIPWLAGAAGALVGGLLSDAMLRRAGWLRMARSRILTWSAVIAWFLITLVILMPADIAVRARFVLLLIAALVALVFTALPSLLATNVDLLQRVPSFVSGIMLTLMVMAALVAPSLSQLLGHLGGSDLYPMLVVSALNCLMILLTHAFHRPDDSLDDRWNGQA